MNPSSEERSKVLLEASLEEFEARYGSEERYHAHLARHLVRREDGNREIWVLVYGDLEPHAALFAGEERQPRRRRFRSRRAAETWAARLLGIDPDSWAARDEVEPTLHEGFRYGARLRRRAGEPTRLPPHRRRTLLEPGRVVL